MTLLVLCISLIVLGFGAVGILAPLRLIKFVLWFEITHAASTLQPPSASFSVWL